MDASPAAHATGIGARRTAMWRVAIDEFAIGGEQVMHTRLMVADLFGAEHADRPALSRWLTMHDAPDRVLGADFLKAHHLLFAMTQRRLYFTYVGGDLFDTRTEGGVAEPAPASGAAGG